jgi:hypothetical protein
MNKEKLSKTISLLMHQNLCVVNNGTKEKPDFVVGGTELLNKELTKLFYLYGVVKSLKNKAELAIDVWLKDNNYTLTNDGYTRNGITFSFGEMQKRYNDYLKTL